jgi:hypothetical protein
MHVSPSDKRPHATTRKRASNYSLAARGVGVVRQEPGAARAAPLKTIVFALFMGA